VPGCGPRSRGVHGSLADRRAEAKKKFNYVTTRGRNFGVFNGLGHNFSLLTAHLLCLSALGSDMGILAPFGLAPCRLPAADLPQALRLLAVALNAAPWLVLALASLAQAASRARSAPSGQTAMSSRNVASAHGRYLLPRESSGRVLEHSLRASLKYESYRCLIGYRNFWERDRELNKFIDVIRRKTSG
jgi:hypothetical protein